MLEIVDRETTLVLGMCSDSCWFIFSFRLVEFRYLVIKWTYIEGDGYSGRSSINKSRVSFGMYGLINGERHSGNRPRTRMAASVKVLSQVPAFPRKAPPWNSSLPPSLPPQGAYPSIATGLKLSYSDTTKKSMGPICLRLIKREK